MKGNVPIILALDFPDIQSTLEMIDKTSHLITVYKVGLEFYLAQGKSGIAQIKDSFPNIDIFLDLKLHDIPNTVAGACSSVSELKPRFLTVHASGGGEMVSAAVGASPGTSITAVTVLTSLNTDELYKLGLPDQTQILALSMAKRAVEAGATSIVCSPLEVGMLRKELSNNISLITPGVRPKGASRDDQSRVMTPREAMNAGSDYVVIGRPITKASDPGKAAAEIASTLE